MSSIFDSAPVSSDESQHLVNDGRPLEPDQKKEWGASPEHNRLLQIKLGMLDERREALAALIDGNPIPESQLESMEQEAQAKIAEAKERCEALKAEKHKAEKTFSSPGDSSQDKLTKLNNIARLKNEVESAEQTVEWEEKALEKVRRLGESSRQLEEVLRQMGELRHEKNGLMDLPVIKELYS
jgi:hypothetical protein